jgi:hypothetical protein
MTLALRPSFQQKVLLTSMAFAVALCCVFSFAPQARADGLTNDQKTAILNLLSAFGADQTTVTNVGLALNGQAQPALGHLQRWRMPRRDSNARDAYAMLHRIVSRRLPFVRSDVQRRADLHPQYHLEHDAYAYAV